MAGELMRCYAVFAVGTVAVAIWWPDITPEWAWPMSFASVVVGCVWAAWARSRRGR